MSFKPSRRLGFAGLLSAALVACAWLLAAGGAEIASAQGDPCPNAEFRTGPSANLPECRAYELVSPPDKQGAEIGAVGFNALAQAAASGNGMIYPLNNAVGEAESASIAIWYRATRGGSGWSSESAMAPLAPYADILAFFGPVAASSELDRAVFNANTDENGEPFVDMNGDPISGGSYLYQRFDEGSQELLDFDPTDQFAIGGNQVYGGVDFNPVYFESERQLTPDAPAGGTKLFKYEDGGDITLASVLPDGTPSAGVFGSFQGRKGLRRVSDDGEVVYWNPGGGTSEIYRTEAGETTFVGSGKMRHSSLDGSRAVFTESGGAPDLFLYRHGVGTENISVDNEPADGTDANLVDGGVIGASDDLSRIYFAAEGQIVPGEDTTPGFYKLYLWEEAGGTVSYLGKLSQSPASRSVWNNGDHAAFASERGRVSADGSYMAVRTGDDLTPDDGKDDGGFAQVYVYDLEQDQWSCISCRPDGDPPASGAEFLRNEEFVGRLVLGLRRNVSSQGHVFFETAESLVPEDVNDEIDLYVWKSGELSLISRGHGGEASYFEDASEDGSSVFFQTRDRLTPWDDDNKIDMYVARVDGGFPPPEPPELECSGDECQGDPSGAPADDEPATGGTGAGNPTPTPACDGQQASVDRYDDRIAKLKDKKKRAKRKAKQASGKKAQRKRKRAKRIGKKIRKVRGKKRDAKRDLRACREAQ